MKETNKWSVKDVITTVLLSAVLIVIQLVINMVCMANPGQMQLWQAASP